MTLSYLAKRLLILLLLVSGPAISLFAQPAAAPNWELTFGGKVTEFNEKKQRDLPLEGAVVTLFKGSTQLETQTTSTNGKFKFRLQPNGEYSLTMTKPGYITKRFTINTFNVPNERAENPFSEYDVEVDLFKQFPGLDYSCLNKPIARFAYNPAPDVDDFDYDKIYAAQVQACAENLKRLAEEAKRKQREYEAIIAAADKLFNGSIWQAAKDEDYKALGVLPNDQYPKDQVIKCDEKLGATAAEKKKYDDAIAEANRLFDAKDYANAKVKYQEAAAMRPAEVYPPQRIKACDDAIAAAGKEKAYADAIAAADAKFTAKDWAGAKTEYAKASGMKPAEQYPKDRMKACDDAIAAAGKEKAYADAIADADKKFDAKDFAGAKTKYTEASGMKPAEQYPKDRIKACDDAIAAAGKDKAYADAIAAADQKFDAKDFAGAKTKYTEASGMKPAEQYPKDRIKACDDAIAAAGKDKAYADAVADADVKFNAKDYAAAKTKYTEASGIKPAEQYPKDRIKACDDAIAAAGKDKAYADAIAAADAKFTAKDWAAAKTEYTKASGIKPAEQYPKDRIKACDDAIAAAGKEKTYADAIADADKKFDAKDFTGAKAKYTEASGVKPAEQYPKDRIKACDDAIAAAGLDKQYNDLIKQADTKFTAKDWAGAKAKYTEASGLKAGEQYPKDKIKECDDNLAVAEKDKKYNDLVKQADTKFTAKDWAGAKTIYQEASGVKPDEQHPKDRIKACDDAIAAAGLDAQYNDLVKQADTKFTAKDWNGAKDLYTQASAVKPAQQYPKDRIKACDDALAADSKNKAYNDLISQADAKFGTSDWAGAKTIYQQASDMKPSEAYPKDKIKACDAAIAGAEKDAKYNDLVKQADAKFDAKDWAGAKAIYVEASALKPAEAHPKDRMKLCDTNIAAEGVDKKYNDLIAQADTKFDAKDWAGAKAVYQQASGVKAEEQYPKDRIKACDDNVKADKDKAYNDIVAQADTKFDAKDWAGAKAIYQQASTMRPAEAYPKDRMKLCDTNIAAEGTDKKYNELIAQADTKFDAKDWAGAKAVYQQASGVKVNEQYPKDRIKACDDNIAAAGTEKRYTDIIAAADAKFNAKDWAGAKVKYLEASAIKATEQYPIDRAKECDANIAADQEQKYKDAIAQADTKYDAKDWSGAKVLYQQASTMKPAETYPKDRIKACDDQMALAGVDKKYSDLIKQADTKFDAKDWAGAKALYTQATAVKGEEQYPKDRTKACDDAIAAAGVDKQYNDLVKQADAKFTAKAWGVAKDLYGQASGVKPAEQYPKDRMKACDDNLAGEKDKAYNDVIAAADAKFKAGDWTGAKAKYQEALNMRATEQYPKDQVKACDDNIAATGLDKQYNTVIAAADAKFKAGSWAEAKAKYNEAIGIKANEPYPKDQVKLCDEKINASLSLEGNYKRQVARGDSAMNASDLETAQAAFTAARDLKPAEAYPKQKLDEIARLLAGDQKDRAYRALVSKGDSLMKLDSLADAKKVYQSALAQKPADEYPKKKIDEITRIQNDRKFEATKLKKYNDLIAKADKQFNAKDYKGAKSNYQLALQEKPLEIYPKKRIEACDNALNPRDTTKPVVKPVEGSEQYISDLVKTYPQGITESSGKDAGATTVTRIVIVGNKGWVYKKTVYNWGTFYFKDGVQISEYIFNYETSPGYVQQQQAEYDKNKNK